MVGYRKSHDYPHGKPAALRWLSAAMLIVVLAWVFLVPGYLPRALGILAAFVALDLIDARLHRHYERTGQAVRITQPPTLVVRYPDGLPAPMVLARLAFFVTVAAMLVFGFAPLPELTARHGIIGCVLALFAVGVVNVALEWYYVKVRRAVEVETSRKSDEAGRPC